MNDDELYVARIEGEEVERHWTIPADPRTANKAAQPVGLEGAPETPKLGRLSYPVEQVMPRYQLEQLRGFAQNHVKLIDGPDQELELEARDIYAFAARSDLVLDLFAERDVLLEALEDLLEAEGVLSIAVASRKARLAIAKAKGEGK